MVKRLLWLASLWLIPTLLWAATQVQATVSQNPVQANDGFTLKVVADGNLPSDALDTSPLLKNFIVGNTSVGQNTQIINGDFSQNTTWRVTLIAPKPGNFTIPPLKVDSMMTAPIKLTVVKAGASTKVDSIMLETSMSDHQVYPGQQVSYDVKLLVGADLRQGQLSDPKMDDGDVKQLGKDQKGTETRQGMAFETYSRHYAIFAKKVGSYVIDPPVFNGEIDTQNSLGFYGTRSVGKVGQPQSLTVLPIPDTSKPWLPAREIKLEDRWSQDPKHWKVGQPITRTLVVTATGTEANELPTLQMAVPDGFKSYPDQKDRKNYLKDGWMMAQQTMAQALVPTKAGTYTLPEVDVTWFDTLKGQYEIATLPARTVTVAPAATDQQSKVQADNSTLPPAKANADYWPWLTALVVLLWLVTLVFWLRPKWRKKAPIPSERQPKEEAASPSWQQLRQAIKSNDPAKAGQALLHWAQDKYQLHSLEALAEFFAHPPLTDAIKDLQQQRFATSSHSWNGEPLWQALNTAKPPKAPPEGSGLYARFKL
ncbi:BatD family protein [Gallaecimonas mangrovi]|uniref:BatD family protein n=1 Tax=Gallaecimonas mangrovi TaxID=2291597 RepID=UPI000E2000D1|nr:BatD family protein [Gallaecimonas mangrovi]